MEKKCPLYMPAGTVRATIIIMVTLTLCIQVAKGIPVNDKLFAIWAGMTAFYFGARYLEDRK